MYVTHLGNICRVSVSFSKAKMAEGPYYGGKQK